MLFSRGARYARMSSSSCGGAPCVEVVVREVWRRALAGQPAPPPPVVLGLAVVAAVLVLAPVAWPRTRHVVTLAHEEAHGLAAVLTGRRLAGIRLHSDTSGLTVSSGRPRGLGMVVTLAAGYLGPGLFGLGAAFLLGAGHAVDVLWLVLVLLVLLLVQIRNWFGFCSVLVTGTVLLATSWWLPDRGQSVLAYLMTWFLLMAAPRGRRPGSRSPTETGRRGKEPAEHVLRPATSPTARARAPATRWRRGSSLPHIEPDYGRPPWRRRGMCRRGAAESRRCRPVPPRCRRG